ncbi:hypothetical protein PRIPAC_95683 [Pristionchus pacificus]|uniref:Uncharacterized protein n=1 Tax=Pristionchus pacificus TaxID=54126 RepID=A0A2A6BCN3_PRIPA|nr:hypothetical protein PRIPAC_95683 [Pristionchus pacificus]|eukprot:PDM63635.1 hypothetical protein PRIPAC_49608 [Pristionchus pacificus]
MEKRSAYQKREVPTRKEKCLPEKRSAYQKRQRGDPQTFSWRSSVLGLRSSVSFFEILGGSVEIGLEEDRGDPQTSSESFVEILGGSVEIGLEEERGDPQRRAPVGILGVRIEEIGLRSAWKEEYEESEGGVEILPSEEKSGEEEERAAGARERRRTTGRKRGSGGVI